MVFVENVLRLLHLPLATIAERVGVGYDTVKGWSYGRSQPTPQNRIALARFVRRHAEELLQVADQLEAGGAFSSPAPTRNRVEATEGQVGVEEGDDDVELTEEQRRIREEVHRALGGHDCDE